MNQLIENFKNKLIVSCQAYPDEPMRHPETMAQIAKAAQIGGAAAIRCQGLSDISAIKGAVDVPVIGLWKEGHDGVYITPSARHALACVMAGADIVAIDATGRQRPDGSFFEDTVNAIRDKSLIMADCSCLEDVKRAINAEVDIISTTLAGYIEGQVKTHGPDFEFLQSAINLARNTKIPVVCEGRIHTLKEAKIAMDMGAYAIIVGTAITHPTSITKWFNEAISNQ